MELNDSLKSNLARLAFWRGGPLFRAEDEVES
jgi:hypothetical protein